MCSNFVIGLLILLVIIYLSGYMSRGEGFRMYDSNSNIYDSIGIVPNKMLYLTPPNPSEPNIDYQDYLNEVSGYDSGTRGYDNPFYALNVANGLDTN